jgi:hypothetical protein
VPHGRQRRPRHHRPEGRGERDAGGGDHGEHQEDVAQRVVDLGQGPRDLDGSAPARQRLREDPHVRGLHVGAGQHRVVRARARDAAGGCGDGERNCGAGGSQDPAVGAHDLRVALGAPQARVVAIAARRREAAVAAELTGSAQALLAVAPGQLLRSRAQRVVDLLVQLGSHGEEDRRRRYEHRHGNGEAGDGGDPVTEGHGSRRA